MSRGSRTVAAACFLGVAYLAYLITRILQENPGIVLTIMDTYR
jgi:hypothetical protein